MRKRLLFAVALSVVLVSATIPASAGQLTLHPSGFGERSYAAWKAQSGLQDSTGNKFQSLYFQKMTATTTFAAGVALFKGFEGTPVSALEGLSFYVGSQGHCGAGAPRFNLTVRPTGGGPTQTFFIGCQAMTPTGQTGTAPTGEIFVQRAIKAPFTAACCGPIPTSGFEIASLAIVFDEGNDVGQGFVRLDNIEVDTVPGPGTHVWTSASDNGNGGTTTANTTLTAGELEEALGAPLITLLMP